MYQTYTYNTYTYHTYTYQTYTNHTVPYILCVECQCILASFCVSVSFVSLETGQCLSYWFNISPFIMSQLGWTNLVIWDIARAVSLIKCESAFVLLYSRFLFYNTSPNPSVRWEEGTTAKEHVGRLLLTTYTKIQLSLYLCCITSSNKPSLRPSGPTCQAAEAGDWFSFQTLDQE